MQQLNLPAFDYKLREQEGKKYIFDVVRKKYLVLTPEEWVRQHFIHFLIEHYQYPKSLITVEDSHKVNKMQKRSDVVVYDTDGNVFLLVECKAPSVALTQKGMDQLSTYNQKYRASYLALTNGLKLYVCKMDYVKNKTEFIPQLPEYK